MVKDINGKCSFCGKEQRWSYSGNYRASYCDKDQKTTLEKWDQTRNVWVKVTLNELQTSS